MMVNLLIILETPAEYISYIFVNSVIKLSINFIYTLLFFRIIYTADVQIVIMDSKDFE